MLSRFFKGYGSASVIAATCAIASFSTASANAQQVTLALPTGEGARSLRVANETPIGPLGVPSGALQYVPLEGGLVAIGEATRLRQDLGSAQLQTQITSPFGVRRDPLTAGRRMHSGIDVALPFGTPVTATGAGRVTSSGWSSGYGNLVAIDHGGGVITRYAHLSRILVYTGQTISVGQRVGLVGATGRATGNHLHYEVRIRGVAVDPLGGTLSGGPLRYEYLLAPWRPVAEAPVLRRQEWTNPQVISQLPHAIIR
jgi:murein DD-endopeptidase MepM/ murein hydrolase activator NlpD